MSFETNEFIKKKFIEIGEFKRDNDLEENIGYKRKGDARINYLNDIMTQFMLCHDENVSFQKKNIELQIKVVQGAAKIAELEREILKLNQQLEWGTSTTVGKSS